MLKPEKHLVKQDDVRTALQAEPEYEPDDFDALQLEASEVAIPWLKLLQGLSPEVMEDKGSYIQGARPGMLINSVSKHLYSGKEGVPIIPVTRQHHFIEWVPRDEGGGMVERYLPHDPRIADIRKNAPPRGKILMPNSSNGGKTQTELIEVFTVYGMVLSEPRDGRFERVAVGFDSTDIAGYKNWMTLHDTVQVMVPGVGIKKPALWSHVYRLHAVLKERKGNSWYGWAARWDNVDADQSRLRRDDPLFLAAKYFHKLVEAGKADAAPTGETADAPAAAPGTF